MDNRPDFQKAMLERKSIRSYDGTGLSEEHLKAVSEYIKEIPDPYGIPVTFTLLDAKEHGLSSSVITGERYYVAAKVEKKHGFEVAFGFSFEKLVLYATSLGLGTVWLGGTFKREAFEKVMALSEGEIMPCVTPVGYPAEKKSVREVLMRKGTGANNRLPGKNLFFSEEWGNPLVPDPDITDVFEGVRLAPSAVNKQPWRIISKEGKYHFYEKKNIGFVRETTGDLQKIDIGIALCHFIAGLEAIGKRAEVAISDPGIAIPKDTEYILSVDVR